MFYLYIYVADYTRIIIVVIDKHLFAKELTTRCSIHEDVLLHVLGDFATVKLSALQGHNFQVIIAYLKDFHEQERAGLIKRCYDLLQVSTFLFSFFLSYCANKLSMT